jgi:hypothetical protein
MKVFHVLKTLRLTAHKRLLVQGLRWLIGIAAVLAALSWLVFGATWYLFIGTHTEKACY